MKAIFVDTSHFVAVFNPSDQWHASALEVEAQLQQVKRVTTELVLVEVLNYFAAYHQDVKKNIARAMRRWLESTSVETVLHTHDTFLNGLAFYEARLDKGYSLTDCVSMNVCHGRGITEVLTNDQHFAQEGFRIL
jgi:uncharacterized protein